MRVCSVEGCDLKHSGKGFCKKHLHKFNRYGNPLTTKMEMHGMSKTKEYYTWSSMKDRCINKNHKAFHRYGGRGIMVCERWNNSFVAFYEDMGPKPFKGAEIDRINNDGNYEPDNCRWVKSCENAHNRSTTILDIEKVKEIREKYSTGGITQKQLATQYCVHIMTINNVVKNREWRINNG